ncbi:MAG: ROK family protein, partial [Candidatus Omnitrophota bacterium]
MKKIDTTSCAYPINGYSVDHVTYKDKESLTKRVKSLALEGKSKEKPIHQDVVAYLKERSPPKSVYSKLIFFIERRQIVFTIDDFGTATGFPRSNDHNNTNIRYFEVSQKNEKGLPSYYIHITKAYYKDYLENNAEAQARLLLHFYVERILAPPHDNIRHEFACQKELDLIRPSKRGLYLDESRQNILSQAVAENNYTFFFDLINNYDIRKDPDRIHLQAIYAALSRIEEKIGYFDIQTGKDLLSWHRYMIESVRHLEQWKLSDIMLEISDIIRQGVREGWIKKKLIYISDDTDINTNDILEYNHTFLFPYHYKDYCDNKMIFIPQCIISLNSEVFATIFLELNDKAAQLKRFTEDLRQQALANLANKIIDVEKVTILAKDKVEKAAKKQFPNSDGIGELVETAKEARLEAFTIDCARKIIEEISDDGLRTRLKNKIDQLGFKKNLDINNFSEKQRKFITSNKEDVIKEYYLSEGMQRAFGYIEEIMVVQKIIENAEKDINNKRAKGDKGAVIIGVLGPGGAGKTTFSELLVLAGQVMRRNSGYVGCDGYLHPGTKEDNPEGFRFDMVKYPYGEYRDTHIWGPGIYNDTELWRVLKYLKEGGELSKGEDPHAGKSAERVGPNLDILVSDGVFMGLDKELSELVDIFVSIYVDVTEVTRMRAKIDRDMAKGSTHKGTELVLDFAEKQHHETIDGLRVLMEERSDFVWLREEHKLFVRISSSALGALIRTLSTNISNQSSKIIKWYAPVGSSSAIVSTKPLNVYFSILSALDEEVVSEVKRVEAAGMNGIHIDYLDGVFTPDSEAFDCSKQIRELSFTKLPLIVHLMSVAPDFSLVKRMSDAGLKSKRDKILIHFESFNEIEKLKDIIRKTVGLDLKFGLVLNPETPLSVLENISEMIGREIESIMLMAIVPGACSRPFIPSTLEKIAMLRKFFRERCIHNVPIEIDGGINEESLDRILRKGVDSFVARTWFLKKNRTLEEGVNKMEELFSRITREQDIIFRTLADNGIMIDQYDLNNFMDFCNGFNVFTDKEMIILLSQIPGVQRVTINKDRVIDLYFADRLVRFHKNDIIPVEYAGLKDRIFYDGITIKLYQGDFGANRKGQYILGISGSWHDSTAVLLKDGKIVAALEEERMSRTKHDASKFPILAIHKLIKDENISLEDIAHIAIGWNYNLYIDTPHSPAPSDEFFRKMDEEFAAKKGITINGIIRRNVPEKNKARFSIGNLEEFLVEMRRYYNTRYTPLISFISHHLAHAAPAYYLSGFKDPVLVVCLDGYGDVDSGTVWVGDNGEMEEIGNYTLPNSLGWVWAAMTEYLGFRPTFAEGEIMGLAPYGEPRDDTERHRVKNLRKVFNDYIYFDSTSGKLVANPEYLYYGGIAPGKIRVTNALVKKLQALVPLCTKNSKEIDPLLIEDRPFANLAFVLQETTDSIVTDIVKYHLREARKTRDIKKVSLSGGISLNILANGKIISDGLVDGEDIFVQPAASDSGTAIGAALVVAKEVYGQDVFFEMEHAFYGPEYSDEEIRKVLDRFGLQPGIDYIAANDQKIIDEASRLIVENEPVAWFQGKSELGPRALGARSILLNLLDDTANNTANILKGRQLWRPSACSISESVAKEYFKGIYKSPFMVIAFDVFADKKHMLASGVHQYGKRLARPQTVDGKHNTLYLKLLDKVGELTGVPAVVNTSFNKHEPLVENPEEALNTFRYMPDVDTLFIGNYIVKKNKTKIFDPTVPALSDESDLKNLIKEALTSGDINDWDMLFALITNKYPNSHRILVALQSGLEMREVSIPLVKELFEGPIRQSVLNYISSFLYNYIVAFSAEKVYVGSTNEKMSEAVFYLLANHLKDNFKRLEYFANFGNKVSFLTYDSKENQFLMDKLVRHLLGPLPPEMMKGAFIGIDVGATTIKSVVVRDGLVMEKTTIDTVTTGGKELKDLIMNLAKDMSKGYKIDGIGISLPGVVNPIESKVIWLVNYEYKWGKAHEREDADFREDYGYLHSMLEELKKEYRIECVRVLNDVTSFAVAALNYDKIDDGVLLALGTGVGCARFEGGLIDMSRIEQSGAFVVNLREDAPFDQGCSVKGCFAAFAGVSGILRISQKFALPGIAGKDNLSVLEISQLLKNRDQIGYAEARRVYCDLSHSIYSWMRLMNRMRQDTKFIITGGITVAEAGTGILKGINNLLSEANEERFTVSLSSVDRQYGGAIGAALYASSQLDLKSSSSIIENSTSVFKGAIFDFDGVIADTALVWFEIYKKILASEGKYFDLNLYNGFANGVSGKDAFKAMFPGASEGFIQELDQRKEKAISEFVRDSNGVPLFDSTVSLVKELDRQNIRIAVGSATVFSYYLKESVFNNIIKVIVTKKDVGEGKPSPKIFLLAAQKIGVLPEECVGFEDAPLGVEAFKRGNFGLIIGIDRVGNSQKLEEAGADIVVRDLSELNFARVQSLYKYKHSSSSLLNIRLTAIGRLKSIIGSDIHSSEDIFKANSYIDEAIYENGQFGLLSGLNRWFTPSGMYQVKKQIELPANKPLLILLNKYINKKTGDNLVLREKIETVLLRILAVAEERIVNLEKIMEDILPAVIIIDDVNLMIILNRLLCCFTVIHEALPYGWKIFVDVGKFLPDIIPENCIRGNFWLKPLSIEERIKDIIPGRIISHLDTIIKQFSEKRWDMLSMRLAPERKVALDEGIVVDNISNISIDGNIILANDLRRIGNFWRPQSITKGGEEVYNFRELAIREGVKVIISHGGGHTKSAYLLLLNPVEIDAIGIICEDAIFIKYKHYNETHDNTRFLYYLYAKMLPKIIDMGVAEGKITRTDLYRAIKDQPLAGLYVYNPVIIQPYYYSIHALLTSWISYSLQGLETLHMSQDLPLTDGGKWIYHNFVYALTKLGVYIDETEITNSGIIYDAEGLGSLTPETFNESSNIFSSSPLQELTNPLDRISSVVIPAIDFGGTNIRVALVQRKIRKGQFIGEPIILWKGSCVNPFKIVNGEKVVDLPEAIDSMVALIREGLRSKQMQSRRLLKSVGILAPGAWQENGLVYSGTAFNVPDLERLKFADEITDRLSKEWQVFINNDGVAHSLAMTHHLLSLINLREFASVKDRLKTAPKIINIIPGTGFGAGGLFIKNNQVVVMPGPQQFFDIVIRKGKGIANLACQNTVLQKLDRINGEFLSKLTYSTDASIRASAISIFNQVGMDLSRAIIAIYEGSGRKLIVNIPEELESQFWQSVKGCSIFILGGWLIKSSNRKHILTALKDELNSRGYRDIILIEADRIHGLKEIVGCTGILGASLFVPSRSLIQRDGVSSSPVEIAGKGILFSNNLINKGGVKCTIYRFLNSLALSLQMKGFLSMLNILAGSLVITFLSSRVAGLKGEVVPEPGLSLAMRLVLSSERRPYVVFLKKALPSSAKDTRGKNKNAFVYSSSPIEITTERIVQIEKVLKVEYEGKKFPSGETYFTHTKRVASKVMEFTPEEEAV